MSGAVWGGNIASRFALAACLVSGAAVWGQEVKPEQAKPAQAPAAMQQPSLGADAVAAPVDPKTYVIGAQDVLGIRIWREPELSGSVAVRPDGKIKIGRASCRATV